ncbi:YaiI/YqxD family protein [Noviherbaspirillum sp.]|uniref:YaiI/YqxD family protein n=1 Tax=Noviherbaspirillum sp. TaxID=1926288 RepID=UPI002FE1C2FA
MRIWVDADACPAVVKDILFRAADRLQIQVTLVANKALRTPPSRYIRAMQVPAGFDVADAEIVRQVLEGDLVITADIPLAADVLKKNGHALNPRGELYTQGNIGQHLTMRDMMDQLRSSGIDTGGPAPFSQADRHAFAAALDRFLQQRRY